MCFTEALYLTVIIQNIFNKINAYKQTKIAKPFRSLSIRHPSNPIMSYQCLIDVNLRDFAIWERQWHLFPMNIPDATLTRGLQVHQYKEDDSGHDSEDADLYPDWGAALGFFLLGRWWSGGSGRDLLRTRSRLAKKCGVVWPGKRMAYLLTLSVLNTYLHFMSFFHIDMT